VGFALAAQERVQRPLQTLSNLLAALREGDYSIRARGARRDDALGELIIEVNALGQDPAPTAAGRGGGHCPAA